MSLKTEIIWSKI